MLANTRSYDGCEERFWNRDDLRQSDLSAEIRAMESGQALPDRPGLSGVLYAPWYEDEVLESKVLQRGKGSPVHYAGPLRAAVPAR